MGSNPGFNEKLDEKIRPLDGRKLTKIIKTIKWGKSKKFLKTNNFNH